MSETRETRETNIYIDGSCIHNGSPNAIAGYGVYFKEGDERNEYARVVGKQTNNTGELTAFIRAVEKMHDELSDTTVTKTKSKINIYTDSEYVIKCAGAYGDKLAKNDWKTTAGKVPPNLKLIQRIHEIYKPHKKRFSLQHVKAHTGLDDEHSIGNAEADRLANLAVGVVVSLATPTQRSNSDSLDFTLISNIKETPVVNKNYINIKFDFKDDVKKLGAKWDMSCKKWYYEDNISESNKIAILEIEKKSESDVEVHTKVYVKVPFCKKKDAQNLGCRWDSEKKSWYYMSNLDKKKIEGIIKLEV